VNRVAHDNGVVTAGVNGVHPAFDEGDGSFKHGRSRIFDAVR
jgi:hypothetical protein